MSAKFTHPPHLTDGPPDMVALVDQHGQPDVIVVGEYHLIGHRNYLLSQLPELQSRGYNDFLIEMPVSMNAAIENLKKTGTFPFSSQSGIKSLMLGLNNLGFNIRAVDVIDLEVKGKSLTVENKNLNLKRDSLIEQAHSQKDAYIYKVASTRSYARSQFVQMAKDIDVASIFGSKTLSNLQDKWKFDSEFFDVMVKFQNDLIQADKVRLDLFRNFDFKRNKFMCDRASKVFQDRKAIMLVGGAHVSTEMSALDQDQTIQSILNTQYDVSTITFGFNGLSKCSLYQENIWDWIEKDELNMDVAKAFDFSRTQVLACMNTIADKNFYVDSHEDDDLNEPDIQIHLPQERPIWA